MFDFLIYSKFIWRVRKNFSIPTCFAIALVTSVYHTCHGSYQEWCEKKILCPFHRNTMLQGSLVVLSRLIIMWGSVCFLRWNILPFSSHPDNLFVCSFRSSLKVVISVCFVYLKSSLFLFTQLTAELTLLFPLSIRTTYLFNIFLLPCER